MPTGIGHPTGWKKGYDGSAVRFQPPMTASRLKCRTRAVEMDQCIVLPPFFTHVVSACHDCIQCCITFSRDVSNWRRAHLDSSRGKLLVLVSGRLLFVHSSWVPSARLRCSRSYRRLDDARLSLAACDRKMVLVARPSGSCWLQGREVKLTSD